MYQKISSLVGAGANQQQINNLFLGVPGLSRAQAVVYCDSANKVHTVA